MDGEQRAAFAQRLKQERGRRDLTKSAFAALLGITRTTLRALENGSQYPNAATVALIAKNLQIPIRELEGARPISPDSELLHDLTEDDLRIAQMFHHADLSVKQQTLGVLQTRQPPQGPRPLLTTEITQWVQYLLELPATSRVAATDMIAELRAVHLATHGPAHAALGPPVQVSPSPPRGRHPAHPRSRSQTRKAPA